MKFILVIMMLILGSCTSKNWSGNKAINEFVRMNEAWSARLNKEEIVKFFGPRFKEVEEGILYNYGDTDFTKMAFFFDEEKKLVDQFAIVGQSDLVAFKNGVSCKWTEKITHLKEAHVVKTVESGECPKQHVKYFFRHDLGLYEIKWY